MAQGLSIEAAVTSVVGRFATTRERVLVSRSYTYTERHSVQRQGFSARILPLRVKRVTLTVRRTLPVFPEQRTLLDRPSWSVWCQSTKSLRSSPLRGSKSRGVGSRG